jgi:NADP-dependent 3-hydroxy acid dehydrogenase YdfG
MMRPDDIAQSMLDVVSLPGRTMISELDIRPTSP